MISRNIQALLKSALSLELVGFSTVWNFHQADPVDNLAKKPGTNLYNSVQSLPTGCYTLFVYQIGRSQHSESKIAIFKGLTNVNELGSFYYSKRLGEYFVK